MATYVFGTTSALTGWRKTNGSVKVVTKYDYGMDGEGFHTGSQGFDTMTEHSDSYEANLADDLAAPVLGTTAGVCVTGVNFTRTAAAKATMSVTAHEHSAAGAGNGSYSWELDDYINDSGWGSCDNPIGDALTEGTVLSWSLTASVQHEELNKCDGDHLNAENYDPVIEVTVEITGDDPLDLNTDDTTAGWELISQETVERSPGFKSSVTVARLHLAKPTPPTP
jgi:hypothetical protein